MLPGSADSPDAGEGRTITIVLECSFFFPGVRTRKEKRKILSSVMEGVLPRFRAIGVVVDGQETYQRATVGMALISSSLAEARQRAASLLKTLEADPRFSLYEVRRYEFTP